MFQSHIERFSPCRGGPQVCCARPDRERQRPGLRLTPGVAYRWNPDLSMRRRFKRMMGRARGRRIGVRHFLPRMKWNLLRGGPFATQVSSQFGVLATLPPVQWEVDSGSARAGRAKEPSKLLDGPTDFRGNHYRASGARPPRRQVGHY